MGGINGRSKNVSVRFCVHSSNYGYLCIDGLMEDSLLLTIFQFENTFKEWVISAEFLLVLLFPISLSFISKVNKIFKKK